MKKLVKFLMANVIAVTMFIAVFSPQSVEAAESKEPLVSIDFAQGADDVVLTGAELVNDLTRGNVLKLNGTGSRTSYGTYTTDVFQNNDWTDGMTLSAWIQTSEGSNVHGTTPIYCVDIANQGYIATLCSLETTTNTSGNEDGYVDKVLWNDPEDAAAGKNMTTEGEWQLITVVYDPVANNMRIYIDGEYYATNTINNGDIATLMEQIKIAKSITLGSWNCTWWMHGDYQGLIDDFKLWNSALSEDDIKDLYQTTKAEEQGVFKMTQGGSIRIVEPYGLRFQVKMSKDVKNKVKKVGMLIFPADYLVDNGTDDDVYYESVEALAETNVASHRINLDLTSKLYEKDGCWYGNGAIVNIKEKNMAREFVGIAYYELDGEVTFVDTRKVKTTTRSAAQVALMTYQDDESTYTGAVKTLLLQYIDQLKASGVEDSAPTRYKVRGFAADDGLRFHVVQYVDNLVSTGATWSEQTHVEAQIYQHNIGNGVQNGLNVATYCAFWLDGSSSFNNSINIKNVKNQVSVTDRGEEFTAGYRYEIDYEIFIEFDNNLGNPKDGPYAYVQFKHHMPGESKEGFENARKEHRDDSRYLWQDKSESCYVRPAGIVQQRMGIDHFTTKLENRKEQWERKGNDGQTTLFIGDSFFDIYFWSNFYEEYYPGKDALLLGIGSTTTYDWETWASEWLVNINPKNIVMHMGVNNVYADGDDVEATILGLQNMFRVIHEKLPDTPIYWFGISRPSHGEAKVAKIDLINEYMQGWCAEQGYITYIDTPNKLTADMLKDGTHPKLEYYTVFAEALAETDIVIEDLDNKLPFDFPQVEKFSTINSDLQSVDPNLYNFQMWTRGDGLYTYFVQTVPSVTLNEDDNWKNTHVEMYLSQGDVGNGWNGTYIALFPDETVYISNLKNARSATLHVEVDQIDVSKTVIKYYFYLEFDNNTMSFDPSYAYVKQYQFLPGVTTTGLNSTVITKDGRKLLSGGEVSFQVHETIDKYMTN